MSSPTSKPSESTPQTDPRNPSLWNADRMMEDAVQTLTRRYNLNKEQEEYTRKLLTTRVRAYLADHETDLRQLIRESLDMQIDPRKANADNYKRWGERARPLFERAKKDILEGNKEWGEILNDSQKQIHKFDLDMMQQNFGQIDNLITKWSAGKYNPSDTSPKPPPQIAQDTARVSPGGAVAERRTLEDIWQTYVSLYGSTYGLDPEQANAAKAILSDCRGRAQAYRDRRKAEMTQLDARVNDATAAMNRAAAGPDSQAANARLLEANASKAELEAPIGDIFKDLQQRLDAKLTKAQRDAVSPAQVASLESVAKACVPAAPVVQTPTTVGPASPAKPADQRPAQPAQAPAKLAPTPASKPASAH